MGGSAKNLGESDKSRIGPLDFLGYNFFGLEFLIQLVHEGSWGIAFE